MASFWDEYVRLLNSASWYSAKYDRAAEIGRTPRRFALPLSELTLDEITALAAAGRAPGSKRPGGHRNRDKETDEGNGHARDYLAALSQLGGQAYGPTSVASAVHHAIRLDVPVTPELLVDVPEPPPAVASALVGLAGGGSVATGAAMKLLQRYRRATFATASDSASFTVELDASKIL